MELTGHEIQEAEETFDVPAGVVSGPAEGSKPREVRLLLDNSALTRGFGNVKRWFNEDYIKSQLRATKKASGKKIHLSIYLPSYTLHELEYLRKGNTALASNAREALKFIDEIFDREDAQDSFGGNFVENLETAPSDAAAKLENPLRYNVYIENRTDQFPRWEKCMPFKMHDLQVKDFPYSQTKLPRNIIGAEIFNNLDAQHPQESPEDPVQTPERLKHLIRSCVFKRFLESDSQNMPPLEQWKLVTEDNVTRVWATSFGIDCLNVNEAELLIFLSRDVTSFEQKLIGADFNAEHDVFDQQDKGILHKKIDTTAYEYEPLKGKSKQNKEENGAKPDTSSDEKAELTKAEKKKVKKFKAPVPLTSSEGVRKENFDMINYAPRGKGKLWAPAGSGKKSKKASS